MRKPTAQPWAREESAMLVPAKEMLDARASHYAVVAFNVENLESS